MYTCHKSVSVRRSVARTLFSAFGLAVVLVTPGAETVASPAELAEAFERAKAADRTYVIAMQVDPHDGWTAEGHTWWEVGTPHVSDSESVRRAHAEVESARARQRRGV